MVISRDLEASFEENSAIIPREQLYQMYVKATIVASWEPMPRKRVSADSIARFLCAAKKTTMRDLCAIYARPPF